MLRAAAATRLAGHGDAAALRTVRFALVDLPMAALRREIAAGVPPSEDMQLLVLHTCAYLLRHAARSQPTRRKRR